MSLCIYEFNEYIIIYIGLFTAMMMYVSLILSVQTIEIFEAMIIKSLKSYAQQIVLEFELERKSYTLNKSRF